MSTSLIRIAGATALVLSLVACAPAEQRTPGTIGEANKTTAAAVVGAVGGWRQGSVRIRPDVTGAYEHARLREFILDGATQPVLRILARRHDVPHHSCFVSTYRTRAS